MFLIPKNTCVMVRRVPTNGLGLLAKIKAEQDAAASTSIQEITFAQCVPLSLHTFVYFSNLLNILSFYVSFRQLTVFKFHFFEFPCSVASTKFVNHQFDCFAKLPPATCTGSTHAISCMYAYMYIYIYICVCVCQLPLYAPHPLPPLRSA